MKKFVLLGCVCGLSSCGGGGGGEFYSMDASVIRTYADSSGVARIELPDQSQAYIVSPEIVEVANVFNSEEFLLADVDERDFPIFMKSNGYELREGYSSGAHVILINKDGDVLDADAMLGFAEYDDPDLFLIMSVSKTLSQDLTGSYVYEGVFYSENKNITDVELGEMSLVADFSKNTFSIAAEGDTKFLTGDGFLNARTGQISSSELLFGSIADRGSVTVFPDGTEEVASDASIGTETSIYGTISGKTGESVVGIWQTNESIPNHRGAIIGHR
jgi:hypothetical protein